MKKGIFPSIFPRQYDFEGMLAEQAERTLSGVRSFREWLEETPRREPVVLERLEKEVDELRYRLEEDLTVAFSTPFDRQDIYSLSRQMDYILNFSRETATEMYAFGVEPDSPILEMADALLRGTTCVARGVGTMNSDKAGVERLIRSARASMRRIEDIYISSMAELLQSGDAMVALKKREVYHHLRDAGRALRATVDTLHHAVLGLN